MVKLAEVNSRDVCGLDQLGLPSIELFLPFRATGVPDTQQTASSPYCASASSGMHRNCTLKVGRHTAYSQCRVIVAITAIVEALHAESTNAGNVRDGKWNLPED